jgi:hypothetical protein
VAYNDPTTFAASAARTTSGNSGAQVSEKGLSLHLLAAVTAVSGTTPSMTLSVEWSHDGTTFAASDPADVFTAVTAATNVVKAFANKAPFFRLVWTITGTTPSFTFSASRFTTV